MSRSQNGRFSYHYLSGLAIALLCGSPLLAHETQPPTTSTPPSATTTESSKGTPNSEADTSSSQTDSNNLPKAATPTSNEAQQSVPLAGAKLEEYLSKQYLQYHEAFMNAKTFDDIAFYQSKKVRDDYENKMGQVVDKDKKAIQAIFDLMKAISPRTVRVTKVVVKDDKAELTASSDDPGQLGDALTSGLNKLAATTGATGVKPMNTQSEGKIKMVKEDGQWRVEEERWNSSTSNLSPEQQIKKKVVSDWCAQAASLPFPKKPAAGTIHGQAFKVEKAEMSPNLILSLKQGTEFFADKELTIFIFDMKGIPDGQQIVEKNGENVTKAHCHVHMRWKKVPGDHPRETKAFMGSDGFGLHLVFGKRQNGKLPGYIMLRLPDAQKSFVEGYFYIPAKG